MPNNRIWYACQKAGIAPNGSTTYRVIHGLQSLGITTNFQLTQVFEIGMSSIYENIEGIPSVEVTMQKVMDGTPPIYTLITQGQTSGADLIARSTGKGALGLSIYSDTSTFASAGFQAAVELSGLYFSAISYTVPVDGNAVEDITLVGNNKVWRGTDLTWTSDFTSNSDSPLSINGSGGINRREDVKTGAGGCILPGSLPGVTKFGATTGSGYINITSTANTLHIQNMKVSTDVGRTEIFELGRKGVYYRFANFPTEVTSEFQVLSISGDWVNAIEDTSVGTCGAAGTLVDERIIIKLCEGLYVDCGAKNKLKSIGATGGDTGGGNVELTFTYSNFNDFIVYHWADPQVALNGFRPSGGW